MQSWTTFSRPYGTCHLSNFYPGLRPGLRSAVPAGLILQLLPPAAILLSQTHCAYRYRSVEVVSMSGRWVEAEFEAIFREHYGRIVRVIRRVLQRDSEAEEVCAEPLLAMIARGNTTAA
jgi:hypothetical protein